MYSNGSPQEDRKPSFLLGLKRYGDRRIVRFHTPGHRGGKWLDSLFRAAIGEQAAALDMSDVLEGESGPADWMATIRRAEERAAALFGAAATRFLVNGTSGGLHVALLAAGMSKRAVFSRASHLSVYSGALLAGLEYRCIEPDYDADWDIPGPPARTAIEEALRDWRPELAVETYPNYYGLTPDLSVWTTPCGAPRPPLLITDEAHGSHFIVCPSAPPTALACGAAITVQSLHKTLGALTQASALHVGSAAGHLISQVDRSLSVLQTTSPSPLLLASLEAAVAQLDPRSKNSGAQREGDWDRALRITKELRAAIDAISGFRCLSDEYVGKRWGARLDPARLVINVAGVGWSGIDAARWLRTERRIQVEMANQTSIVALVSPGNTEDDAERLVEGLQDLSRAMPPRRPAPPVAPPPMSRPVIDPREAMRRPAEWVDIAAAAGCIAAEFVCPYPPGMPVLAPGEEITAETVEYLRHVKSVGWEVRGASLWDAGMISVVR